MTGGSRDSGSSVVAGLNKPLLFVLIVSVIVLVDQFTKSLVQQNLVEYDQVAVIGDYVRFTYIYNPGAAFGIHLGDYSRAIFLFLSAVALIALIAMYWVTPIADRARLVAIALICGGAVGNLIDRVRSVRGVVDFLDVGIGDVRWPVFNVADVAVTTGAVLLALSLWGEEQRAETEPDAA